MKKRFLLTSVLMLLLTVMALSTATYAWFSMSMENKVNDVTVTAVSSAGGLEISTDGSAWSSSSVTIANPSLKALDVTTNEGIEFYKGGNNEKGAADQKLTVAKANTDYFEYKLYFKTTSAGDVELNVADSYILPACYMELLAQETGKPTNSSSFIDQALPYGKTDGKFPAAKEATYNKSSAGDFSRDWIAAATRISFQLTGAQTGSDANLVTGTADNLVKSGDAKKALANQPAAVSFDALRAIDLTYSSIDGKYEVKKGTSTSAEATKKVAATATTGVYDLNGGTNTYTLKELFDGSTGESRFVKLFSIKQGAVPSGANQDYVVWEEGKTMIAEVTVRVWIEGQDKDATLPLTAGQFTSALSFRLNTNAQTVKYDGTKYVSLSAFTGQKAGFNWAPLNDTAAVETDGLTAIYFGEITDADHFEGKEAGDDPVAEPAIEAAEKWQDVDITKGNLVQTNAAGKYTLIVELASTLGASVDDTKEYPNGGFLYAAANDNTFTTSDGKRYIYIVCTVAE